MKAYEAEQRRLERQARQDHIESQERLTTLQSDEAYNRAAQISTILRGVTEASCPVSFATLKKRVLYPRFDAHGDDLPATPPERESFMPPALPWWQKLVGLEADHKAKTAAGEDAYSVALHNYEDLEQKRLLRLDEARQKHRAICAALDAKAAALSKEIDDYQASYKQHDHAAIIRYFQFVLERDSLPDGFPREARVAFDTDSKQLVIERRLPIVTDVPSIASFKYVKKTDAIEPVHLRPAELRSMYADAIAQVVLRTLRVAYAADVADSFVVIALNGYVDTIDPATGNRIRPTLISLSTTRDALRSIAFDKVEASACLKNLKALVSRNAHELAPVRPLVSFDMVDRRFIDKKDVLKSLDQRPNLANLTPSEFEALMTNLFEKMGLETRLTQASRDGGVDCVAWDMRPVIGGKVVIQAKRYKHTVGVSAVRDLFGTMMNEGAAKGILVATSGYGQSAYEFAKNKPIELITGSNLLSMLEEYAHVEAKIEFPADWVDATELPEVGIVASSVAPAFSANSNDSLPSKSQLPNDTQLADRQP